MSIPDRTWITTYSTSLLLALLKFTRETHIFDVGTNILKFYFILFFLVFILAILTRVVREAKTVFGTVHNLINYIFIFTLAFLSFIFDENFYFWSNLLFLTKTFIFEKILYFWPKLRFPKRKLGFLTKIRILAKSYVLDH